MCLTSLDLSPSLRERAFKIRLRGWLLGSICIGVWGWGLLITFEYTRHKTPQNTLNHLKTILVQQRVTDFTLVQVMESVSWSVRILWWFHPDMQRLWCHQSSASFFQTRQTYRHPPMLIPASPHMWLRAIKLNCVAIIRDRWCAGPTPRRSRQHLQVSGEWGGATAGWPLTPGKAVRAKADSSCARGRRPAIISFSPAMFYYSTSYFSHYGSARCFAGVRCSMYDLMGALSRHMSGVWSLCCIKLTVSHLDCRAWCSSVIFISLELMT